MAGPRTNRLTPPPIPRGGFQFSIGAVLLSVALLGALLGMLRALGRDSLLVLPALAGATLGATLSTKFTRAVLFACGLGAIVGEVGLYLGLAGTRGGAAAIPAGLPQVAFNFGVGGAILGLAIGAAVGAWRSRGKADSA